MNCMLAPHGGRDSWVRYVGPWKMDRREARGEDGARGGCSNESAEKGGGEIYGKKELHAVLSRAARKEKVADENIAQRRSVLYRALDHRVVVCVHQDLQCPAMATKAQKSRCCHEGSYSEKGKQAVPPLATSGRADICRGKTDRANFLHNVAGEVFRVRPTDCTALEKLT